MKTMLENISDSLLVISKYLILKEKYLWFFFDIVPDIKVIIYVYFKEYLSYIRDGYEKCDYLYTLYIMLCKTSSPDLSVQDNKSVPTTNKLFNFFRVMKNINSNIL